jgi:hypothetical protein
MAMSLPGRYPVRAVIKVKTMGICVRLPAMLAAAMLAAAGHADSWTFEERDDPFAAGTIAVATSAAGPARLFVRCWSSAAALDLRLVFGDGVPLPEQRLPEISLDEAPPQALSWPASATRLALTAPAADWLPLLRGLRNAQAATLYRPVGPEGFEAVPVSLRGSSRAISRVLAACR